MPLTDGATREAVGKNIKKLLDEGKPRAQAVAIALSHARKTAKKGEQKPSANEQKPSANSNH